MLKERLTVTVDRDLVAAAAEAVKEGRADSLSGWVNLALADRAAKDRRLRALTAALSAYEREFGGITAEEIAAQQRVDRESARIVRAAAPPTGRRRPVRRGQ